MIFSYFFIYNLSFDSKLVSTSKISGMLSTELAGSEVAKSDLLACAG